MPIYEFRCLKCKEHFELLVMNRNDELEMKCANCNSADFERIISTTNYSIGNVGAGNGSGTNSGVTTQTRTCQSGSCTTYEIPGPTR
jgi:putative FmdB family regulatory protein